MKQVRLKKGTKLDIPIWGNTIAESNLTSVATCDVCSGRLLIEAVECGEATLTVLLHEDLSVDLDVSVVS